MKSKDLGENIFAYLAATAPALLQLIAVVSVGLVDVLSINKFVLNPEFLNLANFFTILLSLCVITVSSFWDYNKFGLLRNGENFLDTVKNFWGNLKKLIVLAFMLVVLFLWIIFNKDKLSYDIAFWTFVQWLTYILALTIISYILYVYVLLKIQQNKNKELEENYVPRLIDSLRRYGHVKDPDIVILQVKREDLKALVRLNNDQVYEIKTDYKGDLIEIALVTPEP